MDSYLKFPAHWCIAILQICRDVNYVKCSIQISQNFILWIPGFNLVSNLLVGHFKQSLQEQIPRVAMQTESVDLQNSDPLIRKRQLITAGPVMINCDPGWSRSQVSRPSEPERGQGGSQCWVSGFRLARPGGNGRRWWWQWQYSAHLPLPVSHNVSAHDSGA